MQHWTFCEVLEALHGTGINKLHLITTHSMAPRSRIDPLPENATAEKVKSRRFFDRCKQRLKQRQNTPFERAWLSLSPDLGYPSTAVFGTQAWGRKKITLALCEFDGSKFIEISDWITNQKSIDPSFGCALFHGDWRNSIRSSNLWGNGVDCIYIEMDPMSYLVKNPQNTDGSDKLCPNDLELLLQYLPNTYQKIIVQISTYSTQRNKVSLDRQKDSITTGLANGEFIFQGETRVGHVMSSFIYAKNISLNLDNLKTNFQHWLKEFSE